MTSRERDGAVGLMAVLGLLVTPSLVLAQDTRAAGIAAGYQFMYEDGEVDVNFPGGWFVSIAGNLGAHVALVGEVTGSHGATLFGADFSVYTYMGGVRVRDRGSRFTPFAQFLVGAARMTATADALGLEIAQVELATEPGLGLDIHLRENLAIRVLAGARRIYVDGPDGKEVRGAVGIVFDIGG